MEFRSCRGYEHIRGWYFTWMSPETGELKQVTLTAIQDVLYKAETH